MWPQIIGGAMSLAGGLFGNSAAKKEAKLKRAIMGDLRGVKYNPFSVQGPGGMGVSFNGNQMNSSFGNNQAMYDMLGQMGMNAMQGDNGAGMARDAGGMAFNNIQNMQGGFQTGLQDTLFGAANTNAGLAGRGFDQLNADTLALLRQQSAEGEERAFNNLQQNQFATGRLGSTGGALQTQAFAKGLAEADISRQLAASGEARNALTASAQAANWLSGAGTGVAGMGDQLMNSAYQQFGNSMGLASDLTGAQINQGGAASGFQNDMMTLLMNMGMMGGNLGSAQANTQINALTGALGGTSGGTQSNFLGDFLTSMGSGSGAGLKELFGKWFGNGDGSSNSGGGVGGAFGGGM